MRHVLRAGLLVAALTALAPGRVLAHCDTLDGPVVLDARDALESREIRPVLKWVPEDREGEVREAFAQALAVRGLGARGRQLADRFFFETVVRLHRAGEGAPHTGLKPAGAALEAAVVASDRALDDGSVESLAGLLAARMEKGLRERFARALEARRHVAESVERGREYVAAYVEFVHYAERLHQDAGRPASHRLDAHEH